MTCQHPSSATNTNANSSDGGATSPLRDHQQFCYTSADSYSFTTPLALASQVFAIAVLVAVGLVGNGLLVHTVLSARRSGSALSTSSMLLINLALADLLVGTLVLPLWMVSTATLSWPLPEVVCVLTAFLTVTLMVCSILSLSAIALDRCLLLSYPLRYPAEMTCRRAWLALGCGWSFCLLVGGLPLVGWGEYRFQPQTVPICNPVWVSEVGFAVFLMLLGLALPFAVMMAAYVRIVLIARRHIAMIEATTIVPRPPARAADLDGRHGSAVSRSTARVADAAGCRGDAVSRSPGQGADNDSFHSSVNASTTTSTTTAAEAKECWCGCPDEASRSSSIQKGDIDGLSSGVFRDKQAKTKVEEGERYSTLKENEMGGSLSKVVQVNKGKIRIEEGRSSPGFKGNGNGPLSNSVLRERQGIRENEEARPMRGKGSPDFPVQTATYANKRGKYKGKGDTREGSLRISLMKARVGNSVQTTAAATRKESHLVKQCSDTSSALQSFNAGVTEVRKATVTSPSFVQKCKCGNTSLTSSSSTETVNTSQSVTSHLSTPGFRVTFAARPSVSGNEGFISKRVFSKSVKTANRVFVAVGLFFLCWGPYVILNIWSVNNEFEPVPYSADLLTTLLAFANSAVNPVLFLLNNREYRHRVRMLGRKYWHSCSCRCRKLVPEPIRRRDISWIKESTMGTEVRVGIGGSGRFVKGASVVDSTTEDWMGTSGGNKRKWFRSRRSVVAPSSDPAAVATAW